MSYKDLEIKFINNRNEIRTTKSIERKRKLITENHEIMIEMDKRWN